MRDAIPVFRLPLRAGDDEPLVDLNPLLDDLYERAGYDLSIDYTRAPVPPLRGEDAAWAAELLQAVGLLTNTDLPAAPSSLT